MAEQLRVLIVEDRPADAELMLHELRRAGFEPEWKRVDTEADYVAALHTAVEEGVDMILSDYSMPQFNAMEALLLMQKHGIDLPFVVVTGSISEEVAVKCMKQGATDYLLKDRMARLGEAVKNALRDKGLREEKKRTDEALRESEGQYRGLFEGVPVGLYRATSDGQIIDANLALVTMLGYPDKQALLAYNVADGYQAHEEHQRWQALMARAGEVRGYETQWRRRDGTFIWVRESARAVRDDEGEMLYYDGVIEDITARVRADEALRQRNRELALLHRAGQALISALDLDQVLVTIIDRTRDLLNVDGVSVWLIDTQTDELVCQQASGPQSETVRGWRLAPGEGVAGWVTRHGESLIVADTRADDRHVKQVDEQTGLETRSILCVPLSVKEQVIGVLQVIDVEPDRFEPSDLMLVEQLAATAVIAIQNARLFEQAQQEISERKAAERELQRHTERLRTLRAIDGAILAAWLPEKIVRSALSHMQHLIPYWRASVVLFERDRREATVLAAQTEGETGLRAGTVLPFDQIEGLEELEQGRVLVVEDILAIPSTGPGSFGTVLDRTVQRPGTKGSGQVAQPSEAVRALHAEGLRSYVTVPLLTQGELIGFLNLGADSPHAFTPEHVDIAQEVAGQIAVALRQTRLQEEIQRHVDELEQRVAGRTADLSAANAELARASRLKDEFLASMSHELRTPLNTVLGLSEALQEEVYGSLNERQLRSLGTIEESGRHLLALINDILDVSKIEAGKVELDMGPVSVGQVCQASLGLTKQIAFQKRLQVSSNIDDAVTTLQADERRLKQILVNLLSNAVKFTPEGGEIGLEVVGDPEREAVHFTVWDTGIGISQEDMARLFQPFVQLDSSLSREHAGTGLGLALVHRLTEMHGGGVSLDSEEGQGSRFTVSLPWRPVDGEQCSVVSDQDSESGDQGSGIRDQYSVIGEEGILTPDNRSLITVLLAEDQEANIETIKDYLEVRGYRVIVARNGAEAIERAGEEAPDVILMDVQMPEMDGLEATRRIRADIDPSTGLRTGLAEVPIIALTALAMPGDHQRCLEAGADEYLSKPVSLRELVRVIEAQLSARTEP